jgi:hypothetical protein
MFSQWPYQQMSSYLERRIVRWKSANVSDEHGAFVFILVSTWACSSTLNVICSSKISVHFKRTIWHFIRSRDSVVGIATSYGLDDRGVGVRVLVGSRIFSSPNRPDRQGALSPRIKRPGREVDHKPQTSAEVKKMWSYTSTPIRLNGVVLN